MPSAFLNDASALTLTRRQHSLKDLTPSIKRGFQFSHGKSTENLQREPAGSLCRKAK